MVTETDAEAVKKNHTPELPAASPVNAVNIIAKKRPPPMNIGYSEYGIQSNRKVLYRNFHEISG